MGYFVIFVVEWKQCFSNFHFIAAWSHLLNKYLGPRHLKGTNRKNARETEVVGEATAEVEIMVNPTGLSRTMSRRTGPRTKLDPFGSQYLRSSLIQKI